MPGWCSTRTPAAGIRWQSSHGGRTWFRSGCSGGQKRIGRPASEARPVTDKGPTFVPVVVRRGQLATARALLQARWQVADACADSGPEAGDN
jgi:hypothetical protein